MIKEKEKIYYFTGRVSREIYNSESFKVYALNVDKKKYPDVKRNKYNNVGISGELPTLSDDTEYRIEGIEQTTKYGISYKVLNIRRNEPTTEEDMLIFLNEILTPNQAKVLYDNYPDIVQRVKDNNLDDIDLNKLKGIKEYTFEVIKRKIIENFCLADLVVEFKGYLNLSIIKKIYDRYTSIEVLKEKLRKDPYKCLCGLGGVGFKTADSILLDIEKVSKENIEKGEEPIIDFECDLISSPQRCLACVLYLLGENEKNGHTKMNLIELRKECLNFVPKCIDHFTEVIKDKNVYYSKESLEIALKKTYDTESYIAKTILNALKENNDVWNFDIEKYRNVDGIDISDEQIKSLENLCKYRVSILNGPGGSGKTSSTKAIINMLEDNKKKYKLFAPTGKAAKVIKEYTKRKSSTIHRGLGYHPVGFHYKNGELVDKDDDGNYYYVRTGKQVEEKPYDFFTHFMFNKYSKLVDDVIIIDEFSMVDVFLFESLLSAIDFSKTKLLLIGDSAQLPSVGCGNLLHDFLESNVVPKTTLTKIFRYGEGGLMKVATDVKMCKTYLEPSMKGKQTVFGDNKDYMFIDLASEKVPNTAVALYKKLLTMGYGIEDIQVITSKNIGDCGTIVLNAMLQKVANKNYGSELKITSGDTDYYEGDLIIQKVNNYKAKRDREDLNENEIIVYDDTGHTPTAFIANGESGIIKKIEYPEVVIDFDGTIIRYDKSDLAMIKLGYSITCHASQGSSIKIVILCTPKSHIFMLNSNILYTGLTRMKEKCYHLGTFDTVNQAVKKKANITRNTFMKELLTKEKIIK